VNNKQLLSKISLGCTVRINTGQPDTFVVISLKPLTGVGPDKQLYKIPKTRIIEVKDV
jgi:hypothetical protein